MVSGKTKINVVMAEDTQFLDEVVVVGYGTMKKSDLSGASVSMKESDLKGSVITNLDQSLQGRAAGVSAVQTSGAPELRDRHPQSVSVDRRPSTLRPSLCT